MGLSPVGTVPDVKTPQMFQEQLSHHGLMEKLFDAIDQQLWTTGLVPKCG